MPRPTRQVAKLKQLISLAQDLLSELNSSQQAKRKGGRKGVGVRRRRSGAELARFRKMLKAERKRGVSVADLARQHGVSAAYIYQVS